MRNSDRVYADDWWLYLLKGVFITLIGITALLLPGPAFASLVVLFGVFMIIDGVFAAAFALSMKKKTGNKGWILILGLASIVAGIFIFLNPFAAAVVLIYFFAGWLLFAGITQAIIAISLRKEIKGEGWYILSGILSALFSIFLFINPSSGAITLAIIFGVYALINGISVISLATRLRKHHCILREKGRYGRTIAVE